MTLRRTDERETRGAGPLGGSTAVLWMLRVSALKRDARFEF
jgi:hypothetical protein